MSRQQEKVIHITIHAAVQQSGLSRQTVLECVERSLVVEPLTERDLADLRRIRRLRELGVNMAGIEVILHMRRRIEALQSELARWEQSWSRAGWIERAELPDPTPLANWQQLLPWEPERE
jgi:hypothetical protein